MDSINQLFAIVIALVAGGSLSYLLDDIPAWKNSTNINLKRYAVIGLSALVGFGLVALQGYAPQFIPTPPNEIQVAINWTAVYLASQVFHGEDKSK